VEPDFTTTQSKEWVSREASLVMQYAIEGEDFKKSVADLLTSHD